MQLDVPYRDLGKVRIKPLARLVRDTPDRVWDENTLRQSRFYVHRETRSILLVWSTHDEFPRVQTILCDRYPDFAPALLPIFEAASVRLNEPLAVVTAMLAELRPGGEITAHFDSAELFGHAHRLHVPLFTNPGVEFRVDGQVIPMKAGRLYEIDNRRKHGVVNNGLASRIHLIFDAVPQ